MDLNRLRIPRAVFAVLAMGEVAMLYFLSDQPSLGISMPLPGSIGNVAHIVVNVVLAVLILRALVPADDGLLVSSSWPGLMSRTAVQVLACLLLHGLFDEIHQFFVEGRTCSVIDVISDLGGGFLVLTFPRPRGAPGRPRRIWPFLAILGTVFSLSILGATARPAFDTLLNALLELVTGRSV